MKQAATQRRPNETTSAVIAAWESYCAADYEAVRQIAESSEPGANSDLSELATLARIEEDPSRESGRNAKGSADSSGLFAQLVEGMSAYLRGDYRLAATALGSWLMHKQYYNALMFERFADAAIKSGNHSLAATICRKFAEKEEYTALAAAPLFLSAWYQGEHHEVIAIFQKYKRYLSDAAHIQRLAFALMQLDRFPEAEKILLQLYKSLTGKEYALPYDEVRKRYSPFYESVRSGKLHKESLSEEQKMSLGMAYLLHEEYDSAISLFEELAAKA